jgi:galactokinase
MASSLGRSGEALFIDTRSLETKRVPLPSSIEFVVIDSGVTHKHAGGGYVTRRRESLEAAAALGVPSLRELEPRDLPRLEALPPLLARRARHVITENARVLDAVRALQSGDADVLGRLFTESHRSLRDDYEVSAPDVDRLVDLAQQHGSIYGARMTGGGFGGAVVAAAAPGSAEVAREIAAEYSAETGRFGAVLATIAPEPIAPNPTA